MLMPAIFHYVPARTHDDEGKVIKVENNNQRTYYLVTCAGNWVCMYAKVSRLLLLLMELIIKVEQKRVNFYGVIEREGEGGRRGFENAVNGVNR